MLWRRSVYDHLTRTWTPGYPAEGKKAALRVEPVDHSVVWVARMRQAQYQRRKGRDFAAIGREVGAFFSEDLLHGGTPGEVECQTKK